MYINERGKTMISLHPEYLTKNGKKEFVVLRYEEFSKLQEYLEDMQDLLELRKTKTKEKNRKSISLEKLKSDLNL